MTPSPGLCRSGYGAGRPLWPQWVTSRFRDLCDAAGLPRIGPHGFRHLAATLRFTSGASPKLVSQRIGHASPTVTLTLLARAARPRRGGGRAFAAALADAAKAQSQSECDHDVTM
ncbi:MAG TPA: tyrosine-type recombinase/integrase [Streptosporangiaceae bacterium]|nr:tyrosine-type recombinase/integrase [Streptosporangiaceae bacterium]